MPSKASKIEELLEIATRRALGEMCLRYPDHAPIFSKLKGEICSRVSWEITGSRYSMKELQDIMDWKKGPRHD
jgi:hypothetical protein